MAQVAISGVWIVPPPNMLGAPSHNFTAMNASGMKAGFVFTAPVSGTLDSFEFRLNAVFDNPNNGLRISFQDIDATGNPDGVQDQFRVMAGPFSSLDWVMPGLITDDGTNGGVKRVVTIGQRVAVVIEFESFVAGDSIQITSNAGPGAFTRLADATEYTLVQNAGVWTKIDGGGGSGGNFCAALKYATVGYVPISDTALPSKTWNSRLFNSGSTPDEIGVRFQLPARITCDGAWVRGDWAGDADIVLYDSNGTSVLATGFVDASARAAAGGIDSVVRWAAVTLEPATTYRIAVRPTTVTGLTLYTYTIQSAAHLAATPAGAEFYRTERTNAGAWTETDTETPLIGLHVASIEAGGSSGGGGGGASPVVGGVWG